MAFTLEDLLPSGQQLTTVQPHELALKAIDVMSLHAYGQLPVVTADGKYYDLVVTFESILRAIQAFQTKPENLLVRDATERVRSYQADADLLETLDDIDRANFAVIVDDMGLKGIVTNADVAIFFREYAEDLMLIEEIESRIKDAIRTLYSTDSAGLDSAVAAVTDRGADIRKRIPGMIRAYLGRAGISFPTPETDKLALTDAENKLGLPAPIGKFENLTFNEYIDVLLRHERAPKLSQAKDVTELRGLLQRVRDARNKLAHFRGELTTDERRTIRFAADWLEQNLPAPIPEQPRPEESGIARPEKPKVELTDEEIEEPLGTYAPLARHLRNVSPPTAGVGLTFDEIEKILKNELPRSAFQYRAWWSNDPTKPQSAAWLEEGWRTNAVRMAERRLAFVRTDDRERAYITFFASLNTILADEKSFPLRYSSPQGTSWHTLASLDRSDSATIVASFAKRKRFRVEVYLDYGDKERTKRKFIELREKSSNFEQVFGEPLEWELLEERRASRIAAYTPASILADSENARLVEWAATRALRLFHTFGSAFS
jgi:CBS domain-containing protein